MAVEADSSYWFALQGGYGADVWRATFGELVSNGVIFGPGNDLAVYADSTGMQVKVRSGQGWVEGKHGIFGLETVLPIAAHTTDRVDTVVMRIVEADKKFYLDVVQGTGSPPTLVQNSGIWEEALANITVDSGVTIASGKVTDRRLGAAPPGGPVNCLSTSRPPHHRGLKIIERDTQLRERVSDGTNWLWIPGTGSVVGANVKKGSTAQTLTTGTWTGITLDVENWDHAALHSGSDIGFVASASAIWAFEGFLEYGESGKNGGATWAAGAGHDRHAALHINASAFHSSGAPSHPLRSQQAPYAAATPARVGFYKELDLTAGDHVSLVGYQDQGGNVDVVGATLSARIVGYNV